MAMKTRKAKMKVSALALAVQGVLVAMYAIPARADDGQAAALKVPTNSVELGAISVSRDSAKFGEYTGLNKSGGYFLGDFSIRGGDAYGDGNGAGRWALTGSDLGLTSRAVGATIADQGRWNFGFSYDALTHYTSDSYQTPYQGTMGGNSFTLPSGFGSIATAAPGTRLLSAPQLDAFHNMDISNTRENTSLAAGFNASRQWDIKVDYNHLAQSGAKLMGFGAYGSAAVGGAGTGEKVAILPMPTNSTTDTVNVALNWLGEEAHATLSYSGSFFRQNNNTGVTFETFTGTTNIQTMGTPPSNDFQQLNLTGGYAFWGTTKLAGGLSYGRNTQNTAYAYDTFAMVTPSPTSSLNGYVANTHADLKLTNQTTKDLAFSGAIKYDNRDNRTASNIYNFNAISGGNTANYPNTPLSIKKVLGELAGDYRLDPKQKIRLAISREGVVRQCNDFAVGGGTPAYAPGTNCVIAPSTREDKLNATYRVKASNDVNLNATYGYSDRKTTFDQEARASMIGFDGNVIVNGSNAATSIPGVSGLNAGEFRGFNPFFEESRKQQMLKAGANWQATDEVSVGVSGRYTDDKYDSLYGVQKGGAWSLNLDTAYNYRENSSVTVYVTQQERTRDMTNAQRALTSNPGVASATAVAIPAGATWTNTLKDTDTTVGLNLKEAGLMGGKLVLVGDMTYSIARTAYNTVLNYSTTTTPASGSLTCADPSIYTCVALPDITSRMFQFKLNGTYTLDKSSKIALGYLHRSLHSEDFYYNGLQNGFTPTSVLPTNQAAPSYSLNLVSASYMYIFQ
jgi:MtrB/PioB family decaheme-associated outer membrane protein